MLCECVEPTEHPTGCSHFITERTDMYKVIDFLLAIVDLLNAIAIFIILMIFAIMLPSFITEVTNFITVIVQPYH